jgi:hypothetical protein
MRRSAGERQIRDRHGEGSGLTSDGGSPFRPDIFSDMLLLADLNRSAGEICLVATLLIDGVSRTTFASATSTTTPSEVKW